jgi:hypothetical protein
MKYPRFVRGSIISDPEGGCLISTPRRDLLHVDLTAEELSSLLDACDGRASFRQVSKRYARAGDIRALLGRLCEGGCLDLEKDGDDVRRSGPRLQRRIAERFIAVGSRRLVDVLVDLAPKDGAAVIRHESLETVSA